MKVQLNDPSLVEDLIESLRDWCCVVKRTSERTLDVQFEEQLPEKAARLELDLYLRVWEAKHPGSWATRTN